MKLLIVDDNPSDVELLRHALEWVKGVQFESAADFASARSKLLEFHPDIVFLDINMPDLHRGILRPAMDQVKSFAACVVFTSASAELFAQEVESDGADEFLPKKYLAPSSDPRFLILRMTNGYRCYLDRAGRNENTKIVERELDEAMKLALSRTSPSVNDSTFGVEQNKLIIGLVKQVKTEFKAGLEEHKARLDSHEERLTGLEVLVNTTAESVGILVTNAQEVKDRHDTEDRSADERTRQHKKLVSRLTSLGWIGAGLLVEGILKLLFRL